MTKLNAGISTLKALPYQSDHRLILMTSDGKASTQKYVGVKASGRQRGREDAGAIPTFFLRLFRDIPRTGDKLDRVFDSF